MEQKQPLQQMVLGDLDSYVQKNETRSPTYAIHKNKFRMDSGSFNVIVPFSQAAFKILSLSLSFKSLILICLCVGLFEFILLRLYCTS